MIRFFRKIRQRLLTESKFSKYILYAIGEIVLVVAGILIAVQIDSKLENDKKLKHVPKILETPKGKEQLEDLENLDALVGLIKTRA